MQPWKRTYWAVWCSNAITAVGMMSFLPFFPGHLRKLGLTDEHEIATWAGLIFGAAPFMAALMGPIWGALGDRFGRRVMVVRAMLGITVFVGLMALATEPWQLLVLRAGQGLLAGFVAPSQTLVSVAAPPGRQGAVAAGLQMALAAGAIVGPLVGGFVSGSYGLVPLFAGVSALSALSAGVVLAFTEEDAATRQVGGGRVRVAGLARGVARDVAEVFGNRNVRAGLMLLFWIQFGLGATNPVMELFVGDLLPTAGSETVAKVTGALFTVMAATNLVAMPLWGRYGDRRGHSRALLACALGCTAALGLHAAAYVVLLLFVARILLGAMTAGSGPLAFGLAAAEIAVDRRGGAFGVVFSSRALAVAVAAMAGGWISGIIGIRGLFLVGALGIGVNLAVATRALAGRREELGSG